jgi:hypothetical protein
LPEGEEGSERNERERETLDRERKREREREREKTRNGGECAPADGRCGGIQ